MQIANALDTLFLKTVGDSLDPDKGEIGLGAKVGLTARKVLGIGIFTTVSWGLCWLKPRVSPLGFMTGFIFRNEVQNKMDELNKLTPAKSKVTVLFVSTSIMISGVVSFPVLIPVVLFGTSVLMGKISRDLLYPPELNEN